MNLTLSAQEQSDADAQARLATPRELHRRFRYSSVHAGPLRNPVFRMTRRSLRANLPEPPNEDRPRLVQGTPQLD